MADPREFMRQQLRDVESALGVPFELMFPIIGGQPLPWRVIAPHEPQAISNHGQPLARLAARGGLSACEAVAVLENRGWYQMEAHAAERRLREIAASA